MEKQLTISKREARELAGYLEELTKIRHEKDKKNSSMIAYPTLAEYIEEFRKYAEDNN